MRRTGNFVAACAVAATVLTAFAAESPSPARASAAHRLYAIGSDVAIPRPGRLALRAGPGSRRVLARVGRRTVFGTPTRLAVVGSSGEWLAVVSAMLGNRVRGFVHRTSVRLVHDPFSLEIDLSARRLTVWRMGAALRRVGIGIGGPASPTPAGRFSITDKLTNFMPSVYGCCILALSGRQTRIPEGWRGGARLAIHVGSSVGGAVSAGCVRASERDVRYLMRMLPLGTQVVIHS